MVTSKVFRLCGAMVSHDLPDATTSQIALARCDCLMDQYMEEGDQGEEQCWLGSRVHLICYHASLTPRLATTTMQTEQNAKLLGAISMALARAAKREIRDT